MFESIIRGVLGVAVLLGVCLLLSDRRSDLAALGFHSMVGGTIASLFTASMAGVFHGVRWSRRGGVADVRGIAGGPRIEGSTGERPLLE